MKAISICLQERPMGYVAPEWSHENKKMVSDRSVSAWCAKLREAAVNAFERKAGKDVRPYEVALKASLTIYYKLPKDAGKISQRKVQTDELRPLVSPPAHNVAKLVFETCKGVVFADPSYLVEVHIAKKYVRNEEDLRVEVTFTPWPR